MAVPFFIGNFAAIMKEVTIKDEVLRKAEQELRFVDEKKLPIRSGVEISYLTDKEQGWIEEIVGSTGVVITPAQAEKIKGYSQSKELTKALLNEILSEEKPKPRKITLSL